MRTFLDSVFSYFGRVGCSKQGRNWGRGIWAANRHRHLMQAAARAKRGREFKKKKKKNPSNGHKAGVGGNRGRLAARLHRSVCNCVWNSGTVSCTRHQHHVHATCKYSTKFFLLACYTGVYAATSRGRQLLILRCGYGDA